MLGDSVGAGTGRKCEAMLTKTFRKYCGLPEPEDIPLRLVKGLAPLILSDPRFQHIPTETLIEMARKKLKSTPADRATAIAILEGVGQ